MASSRSATANPNNRLVPPEQRLWKRYSPHHELPLSAVVSVGLHVLGFFLIALVIGGFLFRIRPDNRPPEVGVVGIALAGEPGGTDAGKAGGGLPEEAVTQQPEQPASTSVRSPVQPLKNLSPEAKPLELVKENERNPTIDAETATASATLKKVGDKVRGEIERLGIKPAGRPDGDDSRKIGSSPSVKRQLRWTLMFNTQDGAHYLRQLQALGALLAIPQEAGQFLVIRDLSRRPPTGQVEDVAQIDRIYWIDDKPESVASLSSALGLPARPGFIAAFFPKALEEDLLEKERRHFKGAEDDIQETKFQVMQRGGTYEAVVVSITSKSGRPRR